jgi:acyl carrier protein
MPAPVNRAEIAAQLRDILNRATNGRVQASQVNEKSRFFDDLGLSSLELMEMRFEIESLWNVVIDDQEVGKLQDVGDVINLIATRTSAG